MDISKYSDKEIEASIKHSREVIEGCQKKIAEQADFIRKLEEEQMYRKYGFKVGNVVQSTTDNKIGVICALGEFRVHIVLIKKNGEVGKNVGWESYDNLKKLYDSYEEYQKALDEL